MKPVENLTEEAGAHPAITVETPMGLMVGTYVPTYLIYHYSMLLSTYSVI